LVNIFRYRGCKQILLSIKQISSGWLEGIFRPCIGKMSCIERQRKNLCKYIFRIGIENLVRIWLQSIGQCIDRLGILILLYRLRLRMDPLEYNFLLDYIGSLVGSGRWRMDQLERIFYFNK